MPSLITCNPGDVVLVRFRFSDSVDTKRRPAVILSCKEYHESRDDAVMCALTTKTDQTYFGDYELRDWSEASLPKPTKCKGVIQTIERNTIERRIGQLSEHDLNGLKESMKQVLGL